MRYTNLLILFVTLAIGIVLYFFKLDQIPSGFYIDEALHGYSAYSILQTGKDEFGKTFPIVFRFYGSYNAPLYVYLTTIPVKVFGLTIFSVRLISALAGFLGFVAIYLLLKSAGVLKRDITPELGVVLYLISPWVILQSRTGYEVTLAFLFFSLGVLLVWRSLSYPFWVIPAITFLSLSTYTAYSERYIAPLFILGSLILFRKTFFSQKFKKHIFLGLLIFFLTQIPHFKILFTPAFFPKSGLFGGGIIESQADKLFIFPRPVALALSFSREFLAQYVTYFSPESLFFLPDPDLQRSIPELSGFYPWIAVPYFVGLYYLWKLRRKNFAKFVILLALVAPLPAALTKDPFSTHRAYPLVLPLVLIVALGADRLISFYPRLSKIFLPVLIFMSLVLLWRGYFILLPKERASYWGYAYKYLADEIVMRPNEVFVIDQARQKPTYIQLAFHLKYPPEEFQALFPKTLQESYYYEANVDTKINFGNIRNRNINWENDIYENQILVGDSLAISETQAKEHYLEKQFEIVSPIDEVLLEGYKTNPIVKCENNYAKEKCSNIVIEPAKL